MLRDLHIKPVLNGWIVTVGCQTVVYNELAVMADEIKKYYSHPEETEKSYRTGAVNKALLDCPQPPCVNRLCSEPQRVMEPCGQQETTRDIDR